MNRFKLRWLLELEWWIWKFDSLTKYRRLKCKLRLHKYRYAMIYIGTRWIHAGKECEYCKCGSVEIKHARKLIGGAYQEGQEKTETNFIAHCNGLEKLVKSYGKKYVQSELDKMP